MTVRRAKTQISLGNHPVWSESLLCAQWVAKDPSFLHATTQSDQSLCCALNGWLRTQAFFMRTVKTLIRLGGCPGWSEPLLGEQSFCWFCHELAQIHDQSNRLWWVFCFSEEILTSTHKICFFMENFRKLSSELPHDKTNKMTVCPGKIQISLGIHPVWSESSLFDWRNLGSLTSHWVHREDSDQTGRMPRLIWVFAGCTSFCWLCQVAAHLNIFRNPPYWNLRHEEKSKLGEKWNLLSTITLAASSRLLGNCDVLPANLPGCLRPFIILLSNPVETNGSSWTSFGNGLKLGLDCRTWNKKNHFMRKRTLAFCSLTVLQFDIFQTHMCSHSMGPETWLFVWSFL